MRNLLLKSWLALAKRDRRVLFLDFLLLAAAVYLGYALRLTILITPEFREDLIKAALLFPLCVTVTTYLGGIYKVYWPQASVEEYARLTRCYVFGSALFLGVNFFMESLVIPRSSLAVTLFAGIVFMGGARASWRLAELSRESLKRLREECKSTLIIGAGEAGAYLARDLARKPGDLLPLGFIDEDEGKQGKSIAGLRILGKKDDLPRIAQELRIQVALIAIPSASGAKIRGYLEPLSRLGVEVRVLPSLHDLAGGQVEVSRLRSVELQDLLRREAIELNTAEIGATLNGKKILITGAGGSIGSEICSQIMQHSPDELFLLGHGEQSIYLLMQHLKDAGVSAPHKPLIADIADTRTMERIFATHRPDVVFHAAAHKHVPLMEENPRESLRVNALGTWTLANLAGRFGVERLVMISSDKAVHPSSVMGATKRVAERLLQSAQQIYPDTRCITVRFGNVLGSRGSVVPLFEKQIRAGGPVTVTHRDMKRYFMLIPEAVSLVLQAGSMGKGGELFVLDMGEPVNITEMAETLIRLHGHEPYTEVPIVFSGIRSGEKLYEELFYDPDHVGKTGHDKIFLTKLNEESVGLQETVEALLNPILSDESIRKGIFSLAEDPSAQVN